MLTTNPFLACWCPTEADQSLNDLILTVVLLIRERWWLLLMMTVFERLYEPSRHLLLILMVEASHTDLLLVRDY